MIYLLCNPPTPAFAKAGAAPGTTGGVELGSRVLSKAHAIKATPLPATCPSHLHAPAVCPASNPPNSPRASKATTLTATCPCHLFFRGFLPFARPQTLQTLLQASKATILTATCPCHLFFRGFKTAVCPASNPPKAPAGLQGNNSYSYMPLPSVFQGVQDCRLPGLKPPKRFQPSRRPPRQQLLQLHAPAICFSGGSRLPFARPQTPQTLPQASKATTLTATCPCHLFFRGFKTAVCPASNPPNASAGLQGNNSYSYMPCHLFFRGFKTAVCPASNPPNAPAGLQGNNYYSYMPLPSVFQVVQDCRLPGLKPAKRFRRPPRQQLLQLHAPAMCFSGGSRLPFARPQTPQTLPQASKATTITATCLCHLFFTGFKTAVCRASNPPNACAGLQGNNSYSYMPLPSVFQGVQDCRLPGLKPPKRSRRPPRQQLLQLHAPAICFSGGSRLPFARPQTPQALPQASKATTLTATCPCHLFFRGFKTAVCPASNPPNASAGLQGNNSYSYMPQPSVFQGVQDCRLPALKPPKRSRRPPRQQLLQLHASAICFSRGSRLPFNHPNASAGLQGNNSYSYMPLPSVFQGFKTAVCPASNPPNAPAGLQGNNSYSYMPLPCVFQGVQDCRLPGLKPPKRSRRPPRQQLLQLHAPAICFFKGFKPAVCPASNPPNASAGLHGNNSYSYMPLPSVFQGVQDCRLPALKPPKRFTTLDRRCSPLSPQTSSYKPVWTRLETQTICNTFGRLLLALQPFAPTSSISLLTLLLPLQTLVPNPNGRCSPLSFGVPPFSPFSLCL